MHRRTVFMSAAVAAALAFTIPANAENGNGGQFAGAFVTRGDYGGGLVGTAYIALHSDGTVTQTSSNPAYSSIHGVWEKTGPKTIRVTEYTFIAVSGAFWGIGRSRWELEFSEDFNTFKGTAYLEGVQCMSDLTCPDPLDPNTPWGPGHVRSLTGTRMVPLPVGPLPLATTWRRD